MALLVPVLFPAMLVAAAPDSAPLVRELFVPFEDLDVVLKGGGRRVFLTRAEYDDLIEKASVAVDTPAPRDTTLLSADYEATVQASRAIVRGSLWIDVTSDGVHTVSLPLEGVGLLKATLDDRPAALSQPAGGKTLLFLQGRGRHELVLDLVLPVQEAAAQRTLSFQLPQAATGRFRLTVPGNVDIKSGATVLSRNVDKQAETTTFELLPGRDPTRLVMSLNNRQTERRHVVVARTVLVDELTETYERLHVTASMEVPYGAVERFRFHIPHGFDVTEVTAPLLSRWQVTEHNGRQILEVLLREPATDIEVLNISAQRNASRLSGWQMPTLVPLDVAGTVSVVGLLVEERLETKSLASQGLIPIDVETLTATLPQSIFASEPGAPAIAPVAAYYAPDSHFQLTANFERPPARLEVASNLLLTLRDSGLELHAGLTLLPLAERTFGCNLLIDAGWEVNSVRSEQQDLDYETYTEADGRTRLQVELPDSVDAGQTYTFHINATYLPDDWLTAWQSRELTFPNVEVLEASGNRGAIAVQAVDDLIVHDQTTSGLTLLDEAEKARHGLGEIPTDLAFQFDAEPIAATLVAQRVPPRITAETYSFLKIEPGQLIAHYELVYDVAEARTHQLSFYLPEDTPAEVSIRGLAGTDLKESTSAVDENGRRWNVGLEGRARGTLRLQVTFEQPLDMQRITTDSGATQLAEALALPLVRAADVEYQTGSVAVEGSPELEIALTTPARRIDVGELIDAHYQPGRRLLGAFGFVGEPVEIRTSLLRPAPYGLPSAIVERAELVSSLSAEGVSQSAARFLLRTKAQFLEIQLPRGSSLWSAYLDGTPSKPQRNDDRLLLSMPSRPGDVVRDLQLVYETPVSSVSMWSDVELGSPRLFLREGPDAPTVEVPMADLAWHVSLPAGYRLAATHGSVTADMQDRTTRAQLAARFTPAEALAVAMTQPARVRSTLHRRWYADVGHAEDGARQQDGPVDSVSPEGADRPGSSSRRETDDELEALVPRVAELQSSKSDARSDPAATPAEPGRPPVLNGFNVPQSTQLDPQAPRPEEFPAQSSGTFATTAAPAQSVGKYWALEGLRSLKIDLLASDDKMAFHSLGGDPVLDITLVDYHRLELLSWAAALLVIAAGLMLAGRSAFTKFRYVAIVLLVATLLPLATGWQREMGRVLDVTFYAGIALIPIYFVIAWGRGLGSRLAPKPTAAALLLASLVMIPGAALAQQETEAQVGPIRVKLIGPETPVQVPEDVIIVPYDPGDAVGTANVEKVIVPYDKYVELWDLAYPDRQLLSIPPPAEFAWAGATWETTLDGDDSLLVEGVLLIDTYVGSLVALPLRVSGGVLEMAVLDGEPARIVSSQTGGDAPDDAGRARQAISSHVPPMTSTLLVSGQGRHRLELSIRYRLARRGGWRAIDGMLPHAPASSLVMHVPAADTEVQLAGKSDQATFETTRNHETLQTSLEPGGRLQLQWRPKVAQAAVDRSLTVQSDAVLDVQEDSLRLVWRSDFLFPRAGRDRFTLKVADEYLVERVTGQNIRGWQREGDQIEVTLLHAARDRQRLTLHMARRGAVGQGDLESIEIPAVEVPEAVLHEGRIAIRRSPLLEIRTEAAEGLVRTDLETVETARTTRSESPLGIRPFQAYRFGRTPYRLSLRATPVDSRITAEIQTLLRIAESQQTMESRVVLRVESRPLHHIELQLPQSFDLKDVKAPGVFRWAITVDDDGTQRLAIHLANGQTGEFSVVVQGKFTVSPAPDADDMLAVDLPRLLVLGAASQESILVVQTDPSYDVRAGQLQDCRQVLLEHAHAWLNEDQRRLARLAIRAPATDFSGNVRLQKRAPRIGCRTVSNLRVTARAFEETVLLDFSIEDGGAREVVFLLPSDLRGARIRTPMLRRKTIEDISADQIRVRLTLHDEVMGQLRVLVENDRLITSSQRSVPIPIVETGLVQAQFVALESAGRDEVFVARTNEIEPLSRQQQPWRVLAELLGDRVSQAFLVATNAQSPQLVVQTRDRQAVETVGARIAFAETLLIVDASGTYRGRQVYQVDNRTEQFLEVALPRQARLWTARVADQAVKPIVGNRVVRIPLVKTAEGDQDYRVELKYGGSLDRVAQLATVHFPLMKTRNIHVEESQVRLRLPETYRWFDFGGTMRHVEGEEDLLAGYLEYKTEQLYEAAAGLTSKNPFARARSMNNLKHYVRELEDSTFEFESKDNRYLNEQVEANRRALEMARRLQEESTGDVAAKVELSNSARLDSLFESQQNELSRNAVGTVGSNFGAVVENSPEATSEQGQPAGQVQQYWIDSNRLSHETDVDRSLAGRVNIGKTAKPQAQPKGLDQRGRPPEVGKGILPPTFKKETAAAPDDVTRQRSNSEKRMQRFQEQLERETERRKHGPSGQAYRYGGFQDGSTRGRRLGGIGGAPPADGDQAAPGGYRGQGGPGGPGLRTTDQPLREPVPPSDLPGPVVATPTRGLSDPQLAATGLASLDVNLPVRGVEYLFTTPRGDIQIEARPLDAALVTRLIRLAAVLAAVIILGLLYRLVMRIGFDRVFSRAVCFLLLLLGVLMLLTGTAPLLALAFLVFSPIQFARLWGRRRRAGRARGGLATA